GRMARQNLQHPTNLLGLACELRARAHEATLLDLEVAPGGAADFLPALRERRPDVVGVSLVTPHVPAAAELLAAARRERPGLFLIAGGPHATALPADLLDEVPELDAVCVGEGDETLPDTCDALERAGWRAWDDAPPGFVGRMIAQRGGVHDATHGLTAGFAARPPRRASAPGPRDASGREAVLAGIPGLHLRGRGPTGAREPLADLDRLAPLDRALLDWPAYERLAGSRGIASPGIIRRGLRAAQVHLSRGCYAACVFCSTNLVWGERARPGIRRRSVACVLEEIDRLVADFGVNHLNFEDDIFPPTLRYLEELGEALVRRPVTWSCNARVDGLRREHFELMARSGCLKIDFGVESGSERILQLNRKLVRREQVVHVFAEARRAGILRTAYLMLGSHVDETPDEVRQTERLAREIEPDFITFTIACPYPGTALWEECKARGFLELGASGRPDWKRFGYYPGLPPWRFTHFTPEQMLATQRRVLRAFYLRPGFMLRMAARARSVQQVKALASAGLDVTRFLVGRVRGAR
ncbi:MAG: radical SAM protein, partial [Planctomycetes bacterium]|nr:radical SAM protein [Planctomycetota bacterium]